MGLVILEQRDAFMHLALIRTINLVVVHNLFDCHVQYQLVFVVKWTGVNVGVTISKYLTNLVIKELNNEAIDHELANQLSNKLIN
jgi:hypothetical protein